MSVRQNRREGNTHRVLDRRVSRLADPLPLGHAVEHPCERQPTSNNQTADAHSTLTTWERRLAPRLPCPLMYFCALDPLSRSATTCVQPECTCGAKRPPFAVMRFWSWRLETLSPVGPLMAMTQPAAVSAYRRLLVAATNRIWTFAEVSASSELSSAHLLPCAGLDLGRPHRPVRVLLSLGLEAHVARDSPEAAVAAALLVSRAARVYVVGLLERVRVGDGVLVRGHRVELGC